MQFFCIFRNSVSFVTENIYRHDDNSFALNVLNSNFHPKSSMENSPLVDELLEGLPPSLDEFLLENAVVVAEGQLSLQGFAGQRRNDDLKQDDLT